MNEEDTPSVVAAIDEAIWEHWTDEDEAAWIKRGKETWGLYVDTEFKVVVAEFSADALASVFATPVLEGRVSP
jgi:hypothetical protein